MGYIPKAPLDDGNHLMSFILFWKLTINCPASGGQSNGYFLPIWKIIQESMSATSIEPQDLQNSFLKNEIYPKVWNDSNHYWDSS